MTTRMLIDAAHPEETRVVVVKGSRLEEFDMESETRRQLRGNIYLAKVTRVEPSLQAAFVDYGGNRHGFLAFSDIHPDYYQIPIADREALIKQQEAIQAAQDRVDEEADDADGPDRASEADEDTDAGDDAEPAADADDDEAESAQAEHAAPDDAEPAEGEADYAAPADETDDDDVAEQTGYEGIADLDEWRRQLTRRYKIQEVIKRRQILLVQVVKEERGNKGAALTAYLSLAGRYCVLMPNSTRGGGISRKITNAADRKKLRGIIEGLDMPDGMRLIVRTAGQSRNKAEIRRDFEYLLRLWDSIRDLTLNSTAPSLIYEDANIIKRSIRDLYTKDISEILVDGAEGHKSAKAFMKMLVPSHARRVQPYQDRIPLFQRYRIEEQFSSMHSPTVRLKSGGYIVIDTTEALVAIDVNSGRSTRGRNIEETAFKTNLEAAEEIARHLRLRDLAGLIVIDFIDMDENRNARKVERCLKDCLKSDRARIQVGRISSFGLLEMSRQRLRPSLVEASTDTCPQCRGTGVVRSTESSALHVLHAIEEEGIQGRASEVTAYVATAVALYVLNRKRASLVALEERFDLRVNVEGDEALRPPEYRLERVATRPARAREDVPEKQESAPPPAEDEENAEDAPKKRRRRGRRGGRRRRKEEAGDGVEAEAASPDTGEEQPGEDSPAEPVSGAGAADAPHEDIGGDGAEPPADAGEEPEARTRPRRRGGRRRRKEEAGDGVEAEAASPDTGKEQPREDSPAEPDGPEEPASEAGAADTPHEETGGDGEEPGARARPRRRGSRRRRKEEAGVETEAASPDTAEERPREDSPAEPNGLEEPASEAEAADAPHEESGGDGEEPPASPFDDDTVLVGSIDAAGGAGEEPEAGTRPRRRGWWQRTSP